MSWYRNPNFFIRCKGLKHRFHIYKIDKKYNVPLNEGDFTNSAVIDFSRHLSLGHNQESDYEALKSWLNEDGKVFTKYVNCQGLVIYRKRYGDIGTWSRVEENDSVFYSLPGIINPYEIKLAEKRADEKKISDLQHKLDYEVTKFNSEVTYLQEQLNQEKNHRQAQVSGLVPYENLNMISTPNNTSVTMMEGSSSWSRVEEDDSTFNTSDIKLAEKQSVEKKMSELVAQNDILREKLKGQLNREKKISELVAEISALKDKLNNEVINLQEQLNQEKNDRKALQTQVLDLTAKLEECRGVEGGIDRRSAGDIYSLC